jgi:hypothetical protein
LAEAVNVNVGDTGDISVRPGQEIVSAGTFHSLFCDNGDCFVIQDRTSDAALYKIGTDLSLTGVRSGLMKGARISYWQDGDKTYYSSAHQNGFIEGGISYPWPANPHTGVETVRAFFPAPLGKHICIFQGRMWIASENVIWISEPFAYGKFDMARRFFQFQSNVTMVKPVQAGVWVSTETETMFVRAADKFDDIKLEQKSAYPAHEYSECVGLLDLSKTDLQIPGQSAIWSSDDGLIVGSSDGSLVVITRNKLVYPKGTQGATVANCFNIINSVY